MALVVKKLPANAGHARDVGWSLGLEDPLEKGLATLFSILTWRIPWTEEPDRLQSTGSPRVGHDGSNLCTCVQAYFYKKTWKVKLQFIHWMLFKNVHIGSKKLLIGLFRSQVDDTSWKVKHLDPTVASHSLDSFFELMDCLGNMDIRNQFNAIICHILSWKMRSMELTSRVENLLRNLFCL